MMLKVDLENIISNANPNSSTGSWDIDKHHASTKFVAAILTEFFVHLVDVEEPALACFTICPCISTLNYSNVLVFFEYLL